MRRETKMRVYKVIRRLIHGNKMLSSKNFQKSRIQTIEIKIYSEKNELRKNE